MILAYNTVFPGLLCKLQMQEYLSLYHHGITTEYQVATYFLFLTKEQFDDTASF